MNEGKEIILKVREISREEAGKGLARVCKDAMSKLNLGTADVIEITGKTTAVAKVWGAGDRGVLRIDGNIRSNASVGIGDKVRIKKVIARDATRITVTPTQPVRIHGGSRLLVDALMDRPVIKGQTIRVETIGGSLTFRITATNPAGPVLIRRYTQIKVAEKPAEEVEVPQVTYDDIGGLEREIKLVREMIELPLRHPELFDKLGIEPPKGVLLYGPPGTGKTLIAKAVANESDANFRSISGPEIMSKYYGESEKRLRELFDEASENAPSIIFIDEIDAIAPKREQVTGEVERRVVSQLLALMDGLKSREQVIVIGATNRVNTLDEALRRGGRFDREIEIGIPNRDGRKEVLQVHTRGMPLSDDVNLDEYSNKTHGFVGADLASLCKEAAMHALRKILPEIDIEAEEIPPEIIERLKVTKEDFDEAIKDVEASAMREVFVEIPKVEWGDIGGLESTKQELMESIVWPIKYRDLYDSIKTEPPRGILLFGLPGTGKTMLAKAIANESEANFIGVKGPELMSKWVGESERAVREIFRKAKQASPCVIFLDEIDSIAPGRGSGSDTHVTERVVSQLLTEMGGLEDLKDVVVVAATNRPDIIDPALLRPGRLDRLIHIKPPTKKELEEIFRVHLGDKPIAKDVDIKELAESTEGYVGADVEAICKEASMLALREFIPKVDEEDMEKASENIVIRKDHFEEAMKKVKPTASRERVKKYEDLTEDLDVSAYA